MINYHWFVFATVLSPVWAWLVWQFAPLKSRKWYLLAEIALFLPTIWLTLRPVQIEAVSYWMHYYFLFLMVYILAFGYKFRFTNFNKVLALSLWILFIAGDFWEVPVFTFDFLSKNGFADGAWWASHIRRLYTLATFALLVKVNGFRFTWKNIGLLFVSAFLLFVVLSPLGDVLYKVDYKTEAARLIGLAFFGVFGYLGLENHEKATT